MVLVILSGGVPTPSLCLLALPLLLALPGAHRRRQFVARL
jgi:MYXO-CTERM domain-containing protein